MLTQNVNRLVMPVCSPSRWLRVTRFHSTLRTPHSASQRAPNAFGALKKPVISHNLICSQLNSPLFNEIPALAAQTTQPAPSCPRPQRTTDNGPLTTHK